MQIEAMKLAIIGGGASGFFLAVNLKRLAPEIDITIFERSPTVLSKVSISGGGRCNLTNSFAEISDLAKAYPRGARLIKRAFKTFDYRDTYRWFEDSGVPLVTQEDQCVFPLSQDSASIIDCLVGQAAKLKVRIATNHTLTSISKDEHYTLRFKECDSQSFDMVAVTTGGHPKSEAFEYLRLLGHKIETPTPSLFTFNIPNDAVRELMGVVVDNAIVSLQGTKLKASGALLITHWGMSGPAVLKLSSYGARILSQNDYRANILVNWVGESNSEEIAEYLDSIILKNPQKQLSSIRPYGLSSRLWTHLLAKVGLSLEQRWGELGRKSVNRLIAVLSSDEYTVHGKSKFREEFVTCGGVSLDSINSSTMESKQCENLYFAGEVLDIDAVTGGFNLQAAWSTAYVVAKAISERCKK